MTSGNNNSYSCPIFDKRYTVGDGIYHRIIDLYIEYLNLIEIIPESENFALFLKNSNLKAVLKKITESIFNKFYFNLILLDTANIGRNYSFYLQKNRPFPFNSKNNFLYEILIDEKSDNFKKFKSVYHKKRLHYFNFHSLKSKCDYIKEACLNYERAIVSASFVHDQDNHTIVKLGKAKKFNEESSSFASSLLSLKGSYDLQDEINNLKNVLTDNLLGDSYNFTIFGTEDKVERLSTNFSNDAYLVLKRDLLAKSGIPETLLFGTNVENQNDMVVRAFYDRLNSLHESIIVPVLEWICEAVGFSGRQFRVSRLEWQDANWRKNEIKETLDIYKEIDDEELKKLALKKLKKFLL